MNWFGKTPIRRDPDSSQKLILVQARQIADDIDEENQSRGGTGRFSGHPTFSTTGYYILDPRKFTVKKLPRTVQYDNGGDISTVVATGSRIYMFGSEIFDDHNPKPKLDTNTELERYFSRPPKHSYFLDWTNSSTLRWERLFDRRLSTDELQLDGGVLYHDKMYFFRDSNFSCLGAFFHPPRNGFYPIESPLSVEQGEKVHLELSPPVLADHKKSRIIVSFNDCSKMYAYYPRVNRWESLVEGFQGWDASSRQLVTLANGVIYVHYPSVKGFFAAFDLDTKEWLNVQVSPAFVGDYKSLLCFSEYTDLLHLGNDTLCLLTWFDKDNGSGQPRTTSFHVVQFKVKLVVKTKDTKEVFVTPLSSEYFHLDSCCLVYGFFPLPEQQQGQGNSSTTNDCGKQDQQTIPQGSSTSGQVKKTTPKAKKITPKRKK